MTEGSSNIVLYIGGEGRSGSTLLSALIGRYDGFFPVGELRGVWQALRTNELCGCGEAFDRCPFWREVGRAAFGGWERVDLERTLLLDASYARHRFVGRLVVPHLRRQHRAPIEELTSMLSSLYLAVQSVSGCRVIVDSTKDPAYALLLKEVGDLDLRLVHLVRDSRAVAYAWTKTQVARPEYAGHPTLAGTFMTSRAPWRAALEWDAKNALIHWLGAAGIPRLLIRYESFTADPDAGLRRILAFAGERDAAPIPGVTGQAAAKQYPSLPHHTVGGNRIRFDRGTVEVRSDREWQQSMGRSERAVVGALTLPLLLAYGYLGPTGRG
ncbi:MAG: sulfotransferase [Gaiellales bacterium]